MKISFPIGELVLRPLLSVLVMSGVILALRPVCDDMGRVLSAVVPIGAGAFAYLVSLVAVKGINEEDIELLPKAEKLLKICKKLKIIR